MADRSSNIIFGKYEMGRLLGKGTFAKVYHAKNIFANENVAIKVLEKEQVRKARMIDQIQREISVMRLVRHPNIVQLKEVLATRSRIFFVMEYVRGGELFAKILKGKLREEIAKKYFQQLISAVDFCHSRGVYHRDLKPENLLLDDEGNLKVSDFGLSALPEQHRHDGLLYTQCGTPAYVAPEVLRRKGYDGAKADIWSCGVILYVLLAGFLPFQDENLMNMYRKLFKGEFEIPPWFSSDARRLISKLLVVDPGKRISIPAIMRVPWFTKGFSRSPSFSIDDPTTIINPTLTSTPNSNPSPKPSPRFYNAFELITSMSSGFDLSSLFDPHAKSGALFTSRLPASSIVKKLESAAKKLNLNVESEKGEFRVKMEGKTEGRMGKLAVIAEVFEAAPGVAVVEFSRSAGDALEYARWIEVDVREEMDDIVWSWQGEDNVKCRD
ncbi:CBL-interacting serine/threonine-protein kinase 5-like protein [Drosera capensis]